MTHDLVDYEGYQALSSEQRMLQRLLGLGRVVSASEVVPISPDSDPFLKEGAAFGREGQAEGEGPLPNASILPRAFREPAGSFVGLAEVSTAFMTEDDVSEVIAALSEMVQRRGVSPEDASTVQAAIAVLRRLTSAPGP